MPRLPRTSFKKKKDGAKGWGSTLRRSHSRARAGLKEKKGRKGKLRERGGGLNRGRDIRRPHEEIGNWATTRRVKYREEGNPGGWGGRGDNHYRGGGNPKAGFLSPSSSRRGAYTVSDVHG